MKVKIVVLDKLVSRKRTVLQVQNPVHGNLLNSIGNSKNCKVPVMNVCNLFPRRSLLR